jgi:hypothetical protein
VSSFLARVSSIQFEVQFGGKRRRRTDISGKPGLKSSQFLSISAGFGSISYADFPRERA